MEHLQVTSGGSVIPLSKDLLLPIPEGHCSPLSGPNAPYLWDPAFTRPFIQKEPT